MNLYIDKQRVLAALRERVEQRLDALTESQLTAQSGAVHEENRQEHSKDTRAIEGQYLARGLAERVEKLRDTLTMLKSWKLPAFGPDRAIGVGALVSLAFDDDDEETLYFLVPDGGGEKLTIDTHSVQTLTPPAPLGRALIGREEGDVFDVALPSGRRELAVLRVC